VKAHRLSFISAAPDIQQAKG